MDISRDSSARTIDSLKMLGLTKYEALVYIGLLKVAGATATELHEISGVPRASVYPVLDRLVQKNLVSVSHSTPKRFNAVAPEEGIDNLLGRIESEAAEAKKALDQIYRRRIEGERGDQEFIWSIYGNQNILVRTIELLRNAEHSIRIVASWPLLKHIVPELQQLNQESVDIEIISDDWEGDMPEGVRIHVFRHPMLHEKTMSLECAGVFQVDGSKVLLWMGSPADVPCALYSESMGFVQFFKRYWSSVKAWVEIIDQ
jgi:HTH-type transcriptional regulator, sugar sensing transcriptional regulator